MPDVSFCELQNLLPGVRANEPVAPHVTFKVGGAMQYFYPAGTDEDLVRAVQMARNLRLPAYLIAGGSNLVFGDGVVPGLAIKVGSGDARVDGGSIEVSAGFPLASLIDLSFEHDLAGLESLSGIPGTVGGAIVGNAGAYGRSISDVVETVTFFDGADKRTISRDACNFSYRHSIFKDHRDWIVVSARIALAPGSRAELLEKSREIIAKRERNYIPGLLCPGSFFKNVLAKDVPASVMERIDQSKIIEGKVPAGYLLESVGAKGMVHGGVRISAGHGNLLINTGSATYADVRSLAELLKARVKERFGLDLEEEIRYIT